MNASTKTETGWRTFFPVVLHGLPELKMDRDQFYRFCRLNSEVKLERSAEGNIEIIPPTGGETGNSNVAIIIRLGVWAEQDGTGLVFDSSTVFGLPNGADRSPDAAWILKSRLDELTNEECRKILPLCPDFVLELRSPSDRLPVLKRKMEEYLVNGARLGLLIDPPKKQVHVYRPGKPGKVLNSPKTVSCEPELPGFILDLQVVWKDLKDR